MSTGNTALGAARARFVRGLEAQATATRRLVDAYAQSPADHGVLSALVGHLQALHGSAQVFQMRAFSEALEQQLHRLDQSGGRGLSATDVAALRAFCNAFGTLAANDARAIARRSSIPPGQMAPVISRSQRPLSKPSPPRQPATRPMQMPTDASAVATVLVLDEPEVHGTVRAALPSDRYDVVHAYHTAEAIQIIVKAAPDLVFVASDIASADAGRFAQDLKKAILGAPPPMVLVYRGEAPKQTAGFAAALPWPLAADSVMRTVRELLGDDGAPGSFARLGTLTLDQLVDKLASELRRGLVDSAFKGQSDRVAFGGDTEIIAALWAAIGRARAVVVDRTEGRVGFTDLRGQPLVSIATADSPGDRFDEVSLQGKKIVVADDDPAVRWFFSGLLGEAGADVIEAEDGMQALSHARAVRPDVIVADILMPAMDGLALCKAIQRDPALSEVPVILLSWKDDFLQRMRELKAGAKGYLRKEAHSQQILNRVRQVLVPRSRLEAELRNPGPVRGRTDGIGVLPLLATVGQVRPDAIVTVRDAWSAIEVELRAGRVVDAVRTASDGTLVRDDRTLAQLVGAASGRFSVQSASSPPRSEQQDLHERLADAARWLSATIDAVSGAALMRVKRVEFDADTLESFAHNSPARVKGLVDKLVAGHAPRQLVLDGHFEAELLDSVLLDLARRGAVQSVRGDRDEDLVAEALEERGLSHPGARVADRWRTRQGTDAFQLVRKRAPSAPAAVEADFDAFVQDAPDLDGLLREAERAKMTHALREAPANPWPSSDGGDAETSTADQAATETRPGVIGWLFVLALVLAVGWLAYSEWGGRFLTD